MPVTESAVDQIENIQNSFSGNIGVAAKNIGTGDTILRDERRPYPTASSVKVPILYEVFRQAKAGAFSLNDRLEYRAEDCVEGSGVLRDLRPGLTPTIHDLCMLMIIISDNAATNMMIDLVGGPDAVNKTMRQDLGLDSIQLYRKIEFDKLKSDSSALAVASPLDLARLVERIALRQAIDQSASDAMLAIMKRQHNLNDVPRFFDYNPYADELENPKQMWIANKTGSISGVRADTGLIGLPDGNVIAYGVMSEGSADTGFTSQNEGEIALGNVGRVLLELWWPQDAGPPPLLS